MSLDRLRSWLSLPALRRGHPLVPVVRLSGVIGAASTFRPGLSLETVAGPLQRAFFLRGAKAVALIVNSPGGSPVQSSLIAKRIRALAAERNLPVYAFVEDVAASGGYWLATAADEIYADASSVVGSIGVIAAGFGFPELLRRHGVERRVYTAGERKMMLDPFQPERPEEVERLRALQAEVHESFKAQVRARRGLKLKGDDSQLFTGEFWTGTRARELGLIDGIGDLRGVMRAHYGPKVRLRLIAPPRGWLSRRLMRSQAVPALPAALDGAAAAQIAEGLLAGLEERALWQRYGL